jgi:low affinity Fe/Cu permease
MLSMLRLPRNSNKLTSTSFFNLKKRRNRAFYAFSLKIQKMDKNKSDWFEKFATTATKATGSNYAFIIACLAIVVWIITGPMFGYSDTWQLVINTATTIVTFLMVFLIQKTQNKDAIAIQIKHNELIAANEKASNRIVSIEDLTEEELVKVNKYYRQLAAIIKKEKNSKVSHLVDDIKILNELKQKVRKNIRAITK